MIKIIKKLIESTINLSCCLGLQVILNIFVILMTPFPRRPFSISPLICGASSSPGINFESLKSGLTYPDPPPPPVSYAPPPPL